MSEKDKQVNQEPYPTRFANNSDLQVKSLFRSEVWDKLDLDAKKDALQELANRDAREMGVEPREVALERMPEMGRYDGQNRIVLNLDMVRDGKIVDEVVDANGVKHIEEMEIPASNWQAMTTVYHENTHNRQYHDMIKEDFENKEDEEHSNRLLENDESYINQGPLYRVQISEKEAFEREQEKTLRDMDMLDRVWGKDRESDTYRKDAEETSNDKAIEAAKQRFGDPNIEKTLEGVFKDRFYGTNNTINTPEGARVNAEINRVQLANAYSPKNNTLSNEANNEKTGTALNTAPDITGRGENTGAQAEDSVHSNASEAPGQAAGGQTGMSDNGNGSENGNENGNDDGGQSNDDMEM